MCVCCPCTCLNVSPVLLLAKMCLLSLYLTKCVCCPYTCLNVSAVLMLLHTWYGLQSIQYIYVQCSNVRRRAWYRQYLVNDMWLGGISWIQWYLGDTGRCEIGWWYEWMKYHAYVYDILHRAILFANDKCCCSWSFNDGEWRWQSSRSTFSTLSCMENSRQGIFFPTNRCTEVSEKGIKEFSAWNTLQ